MLIDLPERKNIRLKNYDYNQNGLYFITICTYDRANIFGRFVGAIHESPAYPSHESPASPDKETDVAQQIYTPKHGSQLVLNQNGEILKSYIEQLPLRYLELTINKYIVMPNHVHLIIEIEERAIRESPLQLRSIISKSIGYLKMNVSKQINAYNDSKIIVWQRSFYDHVIRNAQEYHKVWQYIEENPKKWIEDTYYTG